ncbi:MAG: hypothetical protein ACJ76H_05960 [Bacteriovoracaceae bacterium]
MKIEEIPLFTLAKAFPKWIDEKPLFSENFPEFIYDVSSESPRVRIIHTDRVLFVLEDNIPELRVHGHFKSWDDLALVSEFLEKPVHIVSRFRPEDEAGMVVDPFLLYKTEHHLVTGSQTSFGNIDSHEAAAFVRNKNPELFGRLLLTLIDLSVKEKLYSVMRDERGEIIFLHLARKYGETFDGVYLWSSFPFSGTATAYLQSVQRLGIHRMSSLVLKSNERSKIFHEFLGYRFVREHSFRITSEK